MPTPIKWRSKILLFKLESTYGTDPTPTGADNAILAKNVVLSPMQGTDVDRDLETPYLGAQAMIPADLHRTLTFDIELEGSGTAGTAPLWGPILRACAVAETIVAATSVTYNPISDSHEAGTFYLWVGGTLFKLAGSRGTCVIEVGASGIPYLKFSFTGLYSAATETVRVTPDLSGFQKPRVASNANTPVFTIDSVDHILRSFSLDLGNQVEPRFLIGDESVIITDKKEMVNATIQAVPLTTLNPFGLAEDQTEVEVEIAHGTQAGKISTLNMPACQFMRMDGMENAQNIVEWPLRMTPLYQSGNDQWTLTLT